MAKHEFEMVRRAAKHAQYMHDKRQRVPLPDDDDEDAETTTTARARPTRTPLTTADETTTAPRVRTTIVPVDDEDETTIVPPTTRARVPATTASPTTTAVRAPLTTSTTPSTTSTTPSTTSTSTTARAVTRVPLTTSTTSSSSSSSSTSASSSVSGIGSNADSNNTAASSKGSSNTGAIAGAVIAVLAVLAIAAFFGLRWRKKRKAAAEDAALFPYAGGAKSGGNTDGAFGNKRQSGYNQQVDSYDDLHNNGYDNGYNNGEKPYQSEKPGMASYGALAMNSPNVPMGHEMGGGGNMAGVGRGSYATSHMSPGRDITSGQYGPGSFVGSPSFSQHQQERFSAHSANFGGSNMYGNDPSHVGYPPQAQYGPQASMMRSSEESPISYTTQLPPHQHQALASAVGGALAGGAVAAAAASRNSGQQQAPLAAIPAPLPSPGAQPVQQQQGPFADPNHEGKIYIVTRVFEPSMPDELVFFPGDKIQIVMSYDDGWCLGCNLSSEQRAGEQPARGVFPRDCVEEYVEPAAIALPSSRAPSRGISEGQEQELLHDEDTPLAEQSDLARAPTLPPIEMSRFSIGSNGNRSESRASTVKRQSMLKPTTAPTVVEDDEDPYGGVATSASPNTASFPPDIQVNAAPLAVKRTSHQFGSSQHIADYASQIADDRRLSTLDEENSQLIDEFPVTPRTATTPMSTSSPKSAARLSTAQSIKRSSSLVASKDADLFLALGDVDRK